MTRYYSQFLGLVAKTGCLDHWFFQKYNGVDVKKVGKSKNDLIGYLAKYVTKNEIEFYRFPWHCSRDVSRLFTSVNFEEQNKTKYLNEFPETEENYITKVSKYYYLWRFKFWPNDDIFSDLDIINEMICKSNIKH
jgi:hypothetical protein